MKKIILTVIAVLALAGMVYAAGFSGNKLFFRDSNGVTYQVTPPGAATTMVGSDSTQTLDRKTLNGATLNGGTWNTGTGQKNTLNAPTINGGSWNTGVSQKPTINAPTINGGTWNTGAGTGNALTNATLTNPSASLGSWASGTFSDVVLTNTVTVPAASFTRTALSAPAGSKSLTVMSATITNVAGSGDCYIIVPETGTLSAVQFSAANGLDASDTNYLTFTATNLGQSGGGSTALLNNVATNSTQATGGFWLTINKTRSFEISTVANLSVTAGDRIKLTATQTGTIANTLGFPTWLLKFAGTT